MQKFSLYCIYSCSLYHAVSTFSGVFKQLPRPVPFPTPVSSSGVQAWHGAAERETKRSPPSSFVLSYGYPNFNGRSPGSKYMELRKGTICLRPYIFCGDIPWNFGLIYIYIYRPYIWNRYLQWIGSCCMAIDEIPDGDPSNEELPQEWDRPKMTILTRENDDNWWT